MAIVCLAVLFKKVWVTVDGRVLFNRLFLLNVSVQVMSGPGRHKFRNRKHILFLLSGRRGVSRHRLTDLTRVGPNSVARVLAEVRESNLVAERHSIDSGHIVRIQLAGTNARLTGRGRRHRR